MNFRKALVAATLAAVSTLAVAEPQSLVRNPGFEDGTQDWLVRGFHSISSGPQQARVLTRCPGARCVGTPGAGAFIGQINRAPGQLYDLGFFAGADTGPGDFSIFWNDLLVDDQPLATSTVSQHSNTSLLATSDIAWLEIHGRDDPAQMWPDNVRGTQHMASPVPEPQTFAMLLSGLLFAGLASRRGP